MFFPINPIATTIVTSQLPRRLTHFDSATLKLWDNRWFVVVANDFCYFVFTNNTNPGSWYIIYLEGGAAPNTAITSHVWLTLWCWAWSKSMTELSSRHQKMMPWGMTSENTWECLEASCGLCLGMPQGIMRSEWVNINKIFNIHQIKWKQPVSTNPKVLHHVKFSIVRVNHTMVQRSWVAPFKVIFAKK